MSAPRLGPRAPRSIQQIAATAADFVYNPHISFKNWLRAARSLRQQAEIYEAEGDLEQAYELYMRQVVLVLEHLPKHPQLKAGNNRSLFNAAAKDAQISLSRCENLKPYIKAAYDDYEKLRKVREATLAKKRAEAGSISSRPGSSSSLNRLSGDYSGHRYEEYSGQLHRDVALEVGRRDQRSSTYTRRPPPSSNDDTNLSQQMQGVRLQLDGKSTNTKRLPSSLETRNPSSTSWAYPSVPDSKPTASGSQKELWLSGNGSQYKDSRIFGSDIPEQLSIKSPTSKPILPRKEPLQYIEGPARPPKQSGNLDLQQPVASFTSAPQPPPKAIPPVIPETRVFKPAAYLENGAPLRSVFFPPKMRLDFLRLAQQNTSRGLETCGILCGTLKSNALFIEKLVLPEQESTSDTCEMTEDGEIALFDYCESQDLLTLGWIHTHPTQTCFMSSRDLHTHCGYQAMMAESIAIVCAPSLNQWGTYRLTDPPGMKTIQNCTKPGIFHPHDVGNIYTEATRPGHVVELEGLGYDVQDMRKY